MKNKSAGEKVAEKLGEIIAEIQKGASNPKKESTAFFILITILLLIMAIFIGVSVETRKTTKAFEQREFGRIINQTWGLDVK